MLMSFKQYCKERTGSSYLRSLMQKNFKGIMVFHNVFGWKHGAPVGSKQWLKNRTNDRGIVMSIYGQPEKYSYDLLSEYAENTPVPLISIKDPYAFVASFKKFTAGGQHHTWETAPIEEWCRDFNHKYYAWFDFGKDGPGTKKAIVVRYEDLIDDFKAVLRDIGDKHNLEFQLEEIAGEDRVVRPATEYQIGYGKKFNPKPYIKRDYLNEIPFDIKDRISKSIDWDLFHKYGYEPL